MVLKPIVLASLRHYCACNGGFVLQPRSLIYLYANLVIRGLLPLIVIPIANLLLDQDAFGKLTALYSVSVIAGFVVDYCVNVYGTTELAQLLHEEKRRYINNLTALKMYIGFFVLIVSVISIVTIKPDFAALLSLFLVITVLSAVLDCNWVFFEAKRFDMLAGSSLCGLIFGFFLTLGIYYIFQISDEVAVALLLCLPLFVINFTSCVLLFQNRLYEIKPEKVFSIEFKQIESALKRNISIFLSQIVSTFYSNFASIGLVAIGKPGLAAAWFALNRLCAGLGTLSLIPLRSIYPDLVAHWGSRPNFKSAVLVECWIKFSVIIISSISVLLLLPKQILEHIFIPFEIDFVLFVMIVLFGLMQINGPVFTGFYITQNKRFLILRHTSICLLILVCFFKYLTLAFNFYGWLFCILLSQLFVTIHTLLIIFFPRNLKNYFSLIGNG